MVRFGVIGVDHRHVYHLIGELQNSGAICAGYWGGTSDEKVKAGVKERFPAIPEVDDRRTLLEDPTIGLIVTAGIPAERAGIAIEAMRHGKDVLSDKPGVISEDQLREVEDTIAATGRIFAICFSERMVVPAVGRALELVRQGGIGRVIHTLGIGPHRLNKAIRPPWFFDTSAYGGILVDIASHQIDQFLVFTGSDDAQVEGAMFGHFGQHTEPAFQDYGEIVLASRSNGSRGYVRVDWFTPDGLPTWGDGRLFILGTEGSIEIRKYIDVQGRPGTDHLLLSNAEGTRYIHAENEPLDFFSKFLHDIEARTETAVSQAHTLRVSQLALDADRLARQRSRA